MDFGGSISRSGAAAMPALAILRHELGSLWGGWLVRLWVIGSSLLTLLTLAASWGNLQTAYLIASLLFPFLAFPWFPVAMILGIGPVTGSRLDALADGILSRPITRYEYLVASWAARVITVLAVLLVVTVPFAVMGAFAQRPVAQDSVTLYGAICAFAVVGLVLTFLVSLGFMAGTLLRRPLVAAVVLIFVWFPINLVLDTFALEEFSPISLNRALPTLLRTPWRTAEKEEDRDQGKAEDVEAMARQAAQFLSALSGGQPQPRAGQSPNFFERSDYQDFSLWKVILGYTVPTLAALGLATLCFCRRDL